MRALVMVFFFLLVVALFTSTIGYQVELYTFEHCIYHDFANIIYKK